MQQKKSGCSNYQTVIEKDLTRFVIFQIAISQTFQFQGIEEGIFLYVWKNQLPTEIRQWVFRKISDQLIRPEISDLIGV